MANAQQITVHTRNPAKRWPELMMCQSTQVSGQWHFSEAAGSWTVLFFLKSPKRLQRTPKKKTGTTDPTLFWLIPALSWKFTSQQSFIKKGFTCCSSDRRRFLGGMKPSLGTGCSRLISQCHDLLAMTLGGLSFLSGPQVPHWSMGMVSVILPRAAEGTEICSTRSLARGGSIQWVGSNGCGN